MGDELQSYVKILFSEFFAEVRVTTKKGKRIFLFYLKRRENITAPAIRYI